MIRLMLKHEREGEKLRQEDFNETQKTRWGRIKYFFKNEWSIIRNKKPLNWKVPGI